MKLVVTEKNNAATKIADLLGDTKPKADKVFDTPIYRFTHKGEEWVTIGLRGHILEPDFMPNLIYKKTKGWQAVSVEGEISGAKLPKVLPTPPWNTKRKPFTPDGIALGSWKMDALPYLAYGPIEKLPKEKGIIRSLKNLAKKADSIVIATDFDREGELIGSDALSQIREVNKDAPVSRARYSALTKGEVTKAFENLVDLDTNLASAGECRQEIDLIWGAVLTRYLTLVRFAGYGNVRSSGRVQTPTLALIVAKERERKAFVPQDYWVIKALLRLNGAELEATSATERFLSSDAAHAVMAKVEGVKQATITAIETKRRTAAAPTPFNTTSLQTAAAAEGLSPARVMRIAESLYMDGYISYPRVDNTVYPASLDLDATVNMLENVPVYAPYCRELRAAGPLKATRGKQETTDHPPIHPTAPADPDKLDPAAWKLYNLIARRFLATLSKDAIIEGTKITFDINTEPFITRVQVLVEPGFRAIYPYGMKKDAILPKCFQGDFAEVEKVTCEQKQTEPPARYSQGRLIQEMEKLGLGTKATRHSIIERLYTVKYIQNDPIEPSQLGIAVIDAL
ncbi:MAG: DNA topoisomerase, partial [Eggerthellaceae bacterium]|nr:DNA topoisomerase [Eggerthellaceae bacterium]